MPGFLVHDQASVLCLHAGQARPLAVSPRVRVGGRPVVTQVVTYSITGCGLTGTPSPPCATAQWTRAATRVRVGSAAVVLQDSQAVCVPTGTGLDVRVTQRRVKGV